MDKGSNKSFKETQSSHLNKGKEKIPTVFKFRLPGCKFSRAERFSPRRFSLSGEYTSLPNSIGTGRKTSLGYGRRLIIRNSKGQDSPPCNLYNIPSCFPYAIKSVNSPRVKSEFKCLENHDKKTASPTGLSEIFVNKSRYSKNTPLCFKSVEKHFSP